tara:strand:- start:19 stop:1104 length:1086 start_codon:yes stop_codon:yes gene_type:complete
METEDNEMGEFIDFILTPTEKEKEKELNLSHPSVEFEEKEREAADKIMLDKEADAATPYYACHRFSGDARGVCDKIHKLGMWLKEKDGLDMQPIIDTLLKEEKTCTDLNPDYQEPLKYLHSTGKFEDINVKDGIYTSKRLISCELVRDELGNWIYVNKLNTSWSDLAELLTTLLIKGDKISELSKLNITEVKNYLLGLRQGGNPTRQDVTPSYLYRLFKKYFDTKEYRDFTYNTEKNTKIGDAIEDLTVKLLEKQGFKLIYQGGNGDFIDMKYGIDLIMELEGEIYLIQVKSKAAAAKRSVDQKYYRYIDIFAGQTPDQNGIMLYDRDKMKDGEFIGKDILQENLDYLMNKFYDTGDLNLG